MLKHGVTIYFVRHGQTDWNARGLAQGHSDIALNDHGRAQARRNGRELAAALADAGALDFVASPLLRTRETMEIVRGELGLPPQRYSVDERLKEIGFGVSEGSSWPGYVARMMEAERVEGIDPWHFCDAGGESYADLARRSLPVFAEAERDTVVVCHGGISRCLQVALLGIPPQDAITRMVPQDRIMVLRGGGIDWL